jgi:hypothetical protein
MTTRIGIIDGATRPMRSKIVAAARRSRIASSGVHLPAPFLYG